MLHTKEVLNTYLSHFCEQPLEKVRRDTERDFYLTPQEAAQYGLIDVVIPHKHMLTTPPIPSLHVCIYIYIYSCVFLLYVFLILYLCA